MGYFTLNPPPAPAITDQPDDDLVCVEDNTTYTSGFAVSDPAVLSVNSSASAPVALQVDGKTNPTDIAILYPEFTWSLDEAEPGDSRTKYRLQMAYSEAGLDTLPIKDTGEVSSSSSSYTMQDPTPNTGVTVYWRVKIRDGCGNEGPYSSVGTFAYSATVPVEISIFNIE